MDQFNTYNHCIESLRFAFNVIGYDNCIKELNFIQHLNKNIQIPQQKETPIIIDSDSEISFDEPVLENKTITIEQPAKYSRAVLPDTIRCTKIIDTNNTRCSFKRDNNSELCTRHNRS